jgi:branched-chain amino acid transport system ATP-binding protein
VGSIKDPVKSYLNLIGQKLTMIACALATQPKLLLLDEPMAGLNLKEIEQSTRLIKKINRVP